MREINRSDVKYEWAHSEIVEPGDYFFINDYSVERKMTD